MLTYLSIRNIVHKVGVAFRAIAGVVAGVDDAGIVHALKTDTTGKLVLAADIDLKGEPQRVVVDEENVAVVAAANTPQTEFIIVDPAFTPLPPATRRFTIGAKITTGNGNIIVEGRSSVTGAWIQIYSVPIVAGGVADLSYIPSWKRYRAYYKATVNSAGVYFTVMTHPMI